MSTSRVIIFSGKGGTGKTTISAATAALLASRGKKVLIISSDPAHSLGDVVCQPIARTKPTELAPNLYAVEMDALLEARRSLSGLQLFMENSYRKQGVAPSVASELAGQPGLDEILSLNRLMEEAYSGQWDVVIVDTAPTGNTLRLLAYPEMIVGGSSAASMIKAYKGIAKVMKTVSDNAQDSERYFGDVNRLIEIMRKLSQFILSKDVTVRLVLNAEKLSVEETKRAYTFLSLYGVPLDAVMVNKLYPREAADAAYLLGIGNQPNEVTNLGAYFDKWVALQYRYMQEIENSFSALPLFKTFLQRNEPLGVEKLTELGKLVYNEVDPMARLNKQQVVWVEDVKNQGAIRRNLCLRLPFLAENEQPFEVQREGEDLTIQCGRLQRKVSLPRILNDAEFISADYDGAVLRLGFGNAKAPKSTKSVVAVADPFDDDPFSLN